MKKIVAVIEKGGEDGYSVYAADDSVPVVGSGLTEQEARQNFEEVMDEQAEYMKARRVSLRHERVLLEFPVHQRHGVCPPHRHQSLPDAQVQEWIGGSQ